MGRLTESRVATIRPPDKGQDEYPDDIVRGLRLRVGAGGRKAWIVRARAGAKLHNKTLGSYPILSLAKAREEARKFLAVLATDGAPRLERTFGELAQDWLDRVAKPNNRSWRMQERRLERHVYPAWKARKLDSIKRADVRELIDGIEGEVNPNRVLTLVKTIYRHGLARDWLETSPVEGVAKPKQETSRDRVLEMAEAARFYTAADLLGYPFGGFIKLLFLTAQRRTEVAAMRWDQLDLEAGTWTMPAIMAKSDRAHLVPLSSAAVAILETTPRLGDYVWTDNGKTHISGFSKAKARLDSYVAAAEKQSAGDHTLPPWVLHDIRRTVATHMVRLGVLEEVVGRVLNHAVQGVTGKVYALHSYAPEKRSALERWAEDLARAIEGRPAGKVVPLRAVAE